MYRRKNYCLAMLAVVIAIVFAAPHCPAEDVYFGSFEEDVQHNGMIVLDQTAEGYAGWRSWNTVTTEAPVSTTTGVTHGTHSIAFQPGTRDSFKGWRSSCKTCQARRGPMFSRASWITLTSQ